MKAGDYSSIKDHSTDSSTLEPLWCSWQTRAGGKAAEATRESSIGSKQPKLSSRRWSRAWWGFLRIPSLTNAVHQIRTNWCRQIAGVIRGEKEAKARDGSENRSRLRWRRAGPPHFGRYVGYFTVWVTAVMGMAWWRLTWQAIGVQCSRG